MKDKKISIILPTYKPKEYLGDCINSIYIQSYRNFELIIILNGDISNKYIDYINNLLINQPNDIAIHVLKTKTSGVSNARNLGIDIASGEYICFIDDDDIISKYYLEGLIEIADRHTLPISNIHSFINNINDIQDNFFICKHLKEKEKYINSPLHICRSFLSFPVGKLIHRKMINNRRYDCRFKNGEDSLFITSISDEIKSISFTSENAIYYVRERIGSASRKKIPIIELLKDTTHLIIAYITIFLKKPLKYNIILFLLRIPGVLKNTYLLMKNK